MRYKISALTFLLLLWVQPSVGQNVNSPSFILSINSNGANSPETYTERVEQGLKAINRSGKLVIVTNDRTLSEIQDLIRSRFPMDADKVLLIGSEHSKWIRDGAMGWQSFPDGSFQAIGPSRLSNDRTDHYVDALAKCTSGKIKRTAAENLESIQQGGDFVSDGYGTCIGRLDPNDKEEIAKRLGCKVIIPKPAGDEKSNFPHTNHHTDLAVAFIARGVALVSTVDSTCKDEISTKARRFFDAYAEALVKSKIKVIRHPVAGGCPKLETIGSSEDKRKLVTLRSYANLLQTKDSYMVPRYVNTGKETALEKDNIRFQLRMQQLMDQGIIPKKQIVPMPVLETEASYGGSLRCMTWEIPDDLSSCSQDTLDRNLKATRTRLGDATDCLEKNGGNKEICQLSKNVFQVIQKMHVDPFAPDNVFAGNRTEIFLPDGNSIKAKENLLKDIHSSLSKLAAAIEKFCKSI